MYFGRFPSPCKERRLTIPCNGVDEVRMTAEDGSGRPRMTSVSYIGAPVTQPPYPFLHRTPPGKKRKSGPKYPENIGPQAKIFPQNIRSHIGHVPRLSGVLVLLATRHLPLSHHHVMHFYQRFHAPLRTTSWSSADTVRDLGFWMYRSKANH